MSPPSTRRTAVRAGPSGAATPGAAFCQLYVVVLAVLATAVASRFRLVLDQKFTLDAEFIEKILQMSDASLDPEDPFRNIALFYRTLGLSSAPDLAAMLALALFGVGVLGAVRWSELARLGWVGLGAVTVSYALAMIYLSQYSKEIVSLLIALLVVLLPRGVAWEIALLAAMTAYAVTIRPYWGIVIGLYVLGRLLLPRARGLLPVLLAVVVTFVVLQLVFNTFLGETLSFSRTAVNDLRAEINEPVGSLIIDFLPQPGLQWLDAVLVFCSLVVPWPLLQSGSSTYLGMSAVLTFLWGLVAWSIVRLQRERSVAGGRESRSLPGGAPLRERSPRPERAVALLLALVVIQTIFEPDYGSYVKHLVPMLPLFLTLLPLKERRSVTLRQATAMRPTVQRETEGVR